MGELKHPSDRVVALYEQGTSVPRISAETGIPASTVYRYLRNAGINRRGLVKAIVRAGESGDHEKWCVTCMEWKPLADFPADQEGHQGLRANCRICQRNRAAAYSHANKARELERAKRWRRATRQKVLTAYGGATPQCACCGEQHAVFLTIDHINGGGKKHRRMIHRAGTSFYKWLEQEGYPKEYQLLCHNCNFAKGHCDGGCPHQSGHPASSPA